MSDYLYFCYKCNSLVADTYENDEIPCEKCGGIMQPLHIDKDQWNSMDTNKQRDFLAYYRSPQKKKPKSASHKPHQKSERASSHRRPPNRARNRNTMRYLLIAGLILIILAAIAVSVILIKNNKSQDEDKVAETNDDSDLFGTDKENGNEDTDKGSFVSDIVSSVADTFSGPEKLKDDTQLKEGEYVILGSYEQDNNPNNGKEPIEWEVVKLEYGKALLASRYVLDGYPGTEEDKDCIGWVDCSLRQWLNNDFYNEAFTDEEKERIRYSYNINGLNPYSNNYGGTNTEDRVFLLDLNELRLYYQFNDWDDVYKEGCSQELVIDGTPYAKEKTGYKSAIVTKKQNYSYIEKYGYTEDIMENGGGIPWLLRTVGNFDSCFCGVNGFGNTGASMISSLDPYYPVGVRPAIRINYNNMNGYDRPEQSQDESWKKAYQQFLDNKEYLNTDNIYDGDYGEIEDPISFSLYDMDLDGIPELFYFTGSAYYWDSLTFVYSYDNGKVTLLEETLASKDIVCYRHGRQTDYPGLFYNWGNPGNGGISYVYKDGNIPVREEVYSETPLRNDPKGREGFNREVKDNKLYIANEMADDVLYFVTVDDYADMGWNKFLTKFKYD